MPNARSYMRDQLPASLLQRHSDIGTAEHTAFQALKDHSATIFLDETLHRAQVGGSAERLLALRSGQGRKLMVIESVERLLEASVRDSLRSTRAWTISSMHKGLPPAFSWMNRRSLGGKVRLPSSTTTITSASASVRRSGVICV